MDLQLKGKTVVLTGASKGIGLAALRTFAEEGAIVIAAARGMEDLEAECAALRDKGCDVTAAQCDVTKDEDVAKLIDFAKSKVGRIDVFVNNAAGKLPAGDFLGISNDEWLAGWNEKLQCYIRTCRAVFPVMVEQGGGRIVNVLGTAARNPRTSYMPVGVTNAALVNFNKSLADYGAKHNILVSAVAPSGVLTDRWHRLIRKRAEGEGKTPEQLQTEMDKTFPLGRMATPQELADMIVFVASPRASYHSGTVIIVDGASTSGVFN
ncbi:MAG: Short-chain dehydrogenase [Alphaproteobacteria bacterium]|nr:Short-chain dehydrogenase [Alphaproteobacteria bacterium]